MSVLLLELLILAQKVILQLREEYPASSVDEDAEAGAAAH